MSDMRNYQSSDPHSSEHQANRLGLGDHLGNETNDNVIIETVPMFEDTGGLSEVHRSDDEFVEPGAKRNKIIAGAVMALLLGTAGAFTYVTLNSNAPQQVVANNAPPAPVAAMAPAPAPAPMPDTTATPVTTPAAAPEAKTIAPVTRSAARTPRADSTAPVPQNQAAQNQAAMTPAEPAVQNQAAAIPEPVSPTPPAASEAGLPPQGQQSAVEAEPAQQTAPASAVAPAPATQATPEGPAPAQPDGTPAPQ